MDVGGDISAYSRFDLVWADLPSVSDSSSEMDAQQQDQSVSIDPHRPKEDPRPPLIRPAGAQAVYPKGLSFQV